MKTTLNLNRELLTEAIETAVREQISLEKVIEAGLCLRLGSSREDRARPVSTSLAIYQGRGGLAANVDPLSNRSLFAATEA